METILNVNVFTKEGKTKVVFNNKHFLSLDYVKKLTGISCNHHILIGSSIEPKYYKEGDAITDAITCTKDDTIIESAIIELSPKLAMFAMAAAFGTNLVAA